MFFKTSPRCIIRRRIYKPDSNQNLSSDLYTIENSHETISDELSTLIDKHENPIMSTPEETEEINLGIDGESKCVHIGTNLSPEMRSEFISFLRSYVDIFAWSYTDMPGLDKNVVVHRLPLKQEAKPVKQKLRRLKPEWILKIKEEVVKQYNAGFLQVSPYPEWLANIVPVPKKDGRVRMCIDYRNLNKASPKDDFPLPHIDLLVDSTAGHEMMSFMDGFSGYNQIHMAEEDMEKTSFITPWGVFCYRVMPFGLKNAGATYQRAMTALFHDMMHKEIEVYVDDMIVKSQKADSHLECLKKVLDRARTYQLRLNPQKCFFGVTKGKVLGFIVSRRGIEVDPNKVKAIIEMPPPKTEKEIRGLLGRLQYISRFIAQLTSTCEPIFKLLRKNAIKGWNDECQYAFEKLKFYLLNPPILIPPKPKTALLLYLSTTSTSMGCVLGQLDEITKKEHVVYYLSKKFTDCESRYTPIEKICLSLVWATQRLRHYMLSHKIHLISRINPLKYLFEKPALVGRSSKWLLLLSEFDITYITQKSMKAQAIADHLADLAIYDPESISDELPDDNILFAAANTSHQSNSKLKWKMYFDGAVNKHGKGIGAILESPFGSKYPASAKIHFECTNNMAEYEACIFGIKMALEQNISHLHVFGDSLLIISQIKGEWKTKDEKLIPYFEYLEKLIEEFDEIEFTYLSRNKNSYADALATLASWINLTNETMKIQINHHKEPAYCLQIEPYDSHKSLPWFHDIKKYLENQSFPSEINQTDKRTLRRLAMQFTLCGGHLYKRSHNHVLLRCVDRKEAEEIMREVHSGVCGPHMNGLMLAKKIMLQGYYWSTMEVDCCSFVKRCYECQIHGNLIHAPASRLHNLTSPWPFSVWGIDIIGKINPKASNGHEFILVAIDYFTKWVEAMSYSTITAAQVVKFIRNNLICRYGVPNEIITDNGSNLTAKNVENLCKEFKITHHRSSPYRPQMNGAVEAANKNLVRIIEKMVISHKDWHEMLPYALWAYRTSIRTSTGATPYSLTYGMEAVLPVEIEIPSLRVLMEAKLEEAEWLQARYDQLNLIEEKRLTAMSHAQCYQKRIARAYNKKVKQRELKEGDLVLKQTRGNEGKFKPNWEGPYVVKKVYSGNAIKLQNMDGDEHQEPINIQYVKKYYA